MCNWLRDLAIFLNPMNVRVYSAPASLWDRLEHIGTMPARERERKKKRRCRGSRLKACRDCISLCELTHVPSISMKYSLLSQPFCLRMWLCWTPLFLPVKKEQLGARLSWREKNYWGFDIQRFSDGYPRSLHPRYLACFSASGADGFHLDHRAWSCWRVSINASCRPMYFGAWLGGEFAGVDEWCNTLPAMAFAYFWCVLMLIVFAALKANTGRCRPITLYLHVPIWSNMNVHNI